MKYKRLIGLCIILLVGSFFVFFDFDKEEVIITKDTPIFLDIEKETKPSIKISGDVSLPIEEEIIAEEITYSNTHDFLDKIGTNITAIDKLSIENIFENKYDRIKHTINLINEDIEIKTFDYSHRIEIPYNEIYWGGDYYTLTSEPQKLESYYYTDKFTKEKQLITPPIFMGENYARIDFSDIAFYDGYALIYNNTVELRINNILLKAGEELFIDPTYANATDGFATVGGDTGYLCNNGTNFFVQDLSDYSIDMYSMGGVSLATIFTHAWESTSMTCNDTTFFFFHNAEDEVYMYDYTGNAKGTFDTAGDGCALGTGMDSNGSDLWIVDLTADDVFLFHGDGTLITNWDTSGESANPYGVAQNTTDTWVYDGSENVQGYSDGVYNANFDIQVTVLTGLAVGRGMTHNLSDFWFASNSQDFVYHLKCTENCYTGPPNEPPTIEDIADIERNEDFTEFTIDISNNISDAEDDDSDLEISYTLNDTTAFTLAIVNATDVLTFTPTANQSRVVKVSLTIVDTENATAFDSFDLIVNPINDPPWITQTITDLTLDEDFGADIDVITITELQANFSDVEDNNNPSTITLIEENDTTYIDCEIDGSNNLQCSSVIANQSSGSSRIEIEMNDSGNLNTSFSLDLSLININDVPWFDPIPNGTVSITEDIANQNISINASDYFFDEEDGAGNPTITILSDNETGVSCAMDTGDIECSPANNFTGLFILTINGTDSGYSSDTASFEINVIGVNDNPSVTGLSDITMNEDNGTSIVYTETDLDNNFIDSEDNNNPTTTVILLETNTTVIDCSMVSDDIQCVTVANLSGYSDLTLNYTDSGGLSVTDTFRITVSAVNDAPTDPVRSPIVYTHNFSFKGVCSGSFDIEGDAINYEFYIEDATPPTTLRQNSTLTTYITDSLTNGTYYFRCRANDNISNSGYSAITTYDIDNTAIWNYTVESATPVYESSQNNFDLNVTANNLSGFVTDISAKFEYDGTTYSTTKTTISDDYYRFSKTGITAPFETSRQWLWNITYTYYNGTITSENTANFTQTINDVSIYQCLGDTTNATSVMIFNFTLWDEYSDRQLLNITDNSTPYDIKMDMNYYLDDENNFNNLSLVVSNTTNLTVCMNPADVSYNHSTIVDYGGSIYDRRQYYFSNNNFDNVTDHIKLYLLELAKATSTTITVEDENGGALEDSIITIKKYFIGTDEHQTIGMLKTNIDGQDHIYLQHNEPFYKFIITDLNNNIIYTSGNTKITSSSVTLTVGGISWGEEVNIFEDISVSAGFDNSTRTFSLTYSGKNADVDRICMKITREKRSGTTLIGTQCSTETSNTLTQATTGTGLFVMNAWEEKEGTQYPLISKTHDDRKTYSSIIGTEGLFLTLLIILIISFAMIWSPTATIFGSIIGIIISFMFGFLNISFGIIIGLIIVGIILMIKSKV